MKNKINLILCTLILAGLLLSSISAAGLVLTYSEDRPLQMYYGETKTINFPFQNMVGDKDLSIKVELKKGMEIASLEKTTFDVKALTEDTMIPVKITIPKDYSKDVERVEFLVTLVSPEEEGMVTLTSGWRGSFNVMVSKNPESATSLTNVIISLILIIAILAVIVFVLLSKRKNKKIQNIKVKTTKKVKRKKR